jgi:ribosomal protein L29
MQTQLRASRAAFAPSSRPLPRRAVVVQVRPTKFSDFKALSNEEVMEKVAELKKEQFRQQYMRRSGGRVFNPETILASNADDEATPVKITELHHVKRQIAQLMTLIRQRQIEDGVDRKTARQQRKKAFVAGGFGRF